MSLCGCEPIPNENYFELYCKINDALNSCPPGFNLELVIEIGYPGQRPKKKKIGGFDKIKDLYNKCKANSNFTDEDLWIERDGCQYGEPDLNTIGFNLQCKAWANAVKSKMREIYDTIESMREEAKCRPGVPIPQDDPTMNLNTVCWREGIGSPPPVWTPLQNGRI